MCRDGLYVLRQGHVSQNRLCVLAGDMCSDMGCVCWNRIMCPRMYCVSWDGIWVPGCNICPRASPTVQAGTELVPVLVAIP